MTYLLRIRDELEDLIDGLDEYDPEIVVDACVERLVADPLFTSSFATEALPMLVRGQLRVDLAKYRQAAFSSAIENVRGMTAGEIAERAEHRWDHWHEMVQGRRKALRSLTKSDLASTISSRTTRFNQEGRVIAFLITLANNMNAKETVGDAYSDEDLEAIAQAANAAKPTLGAVRAARKARAAV